MHHVPEQNVAGSSSEANKDTNRKLQADDKSSTANGTNNSLMEVDSDDNTSNKRKRIQSNTEAGPVIKVMHKTTSESNDDLEMTSDKNIKQLLLSKLSLPYKELVESSKFDVDGMTI